MTEKQEINIYDVSAFKVWNYQYCEDPQEYIINAYAILLSEAHYLRKMSALLILKILVRDDFLNQLLMDEVLPFTRRDSRVREWVKTVKKRAGNKCELCGSNGKLEAHHMLSWSEYPMGRIDPANGICLCIKCHARMHSGENSEKLILSKV